MGGTVSYDSGAGTGEAYLALPASGGGPAVIVLQEWWGLSGLAMDQTARDLAAAAAYLAGHPEATGRVGAAGFGLGGSLAAWAATLSGHTAAASAWARALELFRTWL